MDSAIVSCYVKLGGYTLVRQNDEKFVHWVIHWVARYCELRDIVTRNLVKLLVFALFPAVINFHLVGVYAYSYKLVVTHLCHIFRWFVKIPTNNESPIICRRKLQANQNLLHSCVRFAIFFDSVFLVLYLENCDNI